MISFSPADESASMNTATEFSPANYPRRLPWPVKIFCALFVFDMIVRSLIVLTPVDTWREKFEMASAPKKLPTEKERQQIITDGGSYAARLGESFSSLGEFCNPVPTEKTREHLKTPRDWGKYALAWVKVRMKMTCYLVGVDQDWSMYSPDVWQTGSVPRVNLIFADGSERELRLPVEPEDGTHFSRWFEKKRLAAASMSRKDSDSRLGYANLLSHQYPQNEQGSPLVRIEWLVVEYESMQPGDDPEEFYHRQGGQPPHTVKPPYWRYDVQTRKGYRLQD